MTQEEAIRMIVRAIRDEGPRPDVHRAIMASHRMEWPALWRGLDALMAVRR